MRREARKMFVLLTGVLLVAGAVAVRADSYYKEIPQFHYTPDEKRGGAVSRFGPVGIGINLTVPAFGMTVKNVEKGSPAEATGKLKAGQIIESINGQTLKDIDPRVILGNIITQVEATDGVVKFRVKEKADSKAEEVIVKIPILGAYSKTWPLKCPKSEKIVRGMAKYLAESGNHAGYGTDQGLLFMLSTGDPKDLEVARGWIKEIVAKTAASATMDVYPWYAGYGGAGLCEYYLRTGDATILPLIEKGADSMKRSIYNGGWAGRGGLPYTYMGGGQMNAAGVHAVKFLLLAKECGVKVDECTLQESLRQFYRYAGHNNVPYGDGLPEGGFTDNGKVGGLAFTMAAAANLTPEGEKSVYAKARDISAIKGFYSTSWMFHGHTGGGIGEIWRSSAMGLMYDKKPLKYREFMDNRMWNYELSRRFNGAIAIVGIQADDRGYDDESWGTGYALTYTVPRKTLRMTGAPPTKFSKTYQLPKRPWGTAADEVFYSLVPAPDKDGKIQDVDSEKLRTDASAPIIRRLAVTNVTDAVLLMYARHPDSGVRQVAADAIAAQRRDHLIVELLKDKDPRGRSSGAEAIYGVFKRRPISQDRLTDEMVGLLFKMVEDPQESVWGAGNAMMALSLAKPDLIVPHVDKLAAWIKPNPNDWWDTTAALFALTPVVADPRCYQKVLPPMGVFLGRSARWGSNVGGRGWAMEGIMRQLQGAKPEVQKFALDVFAKAYSDFPASLTREGGLDMKPVVDYKLNERAWTVANLPGGFDRLYEISRKRFSDQTLPHKDIFFRANPGSFGPRLKEAVEAQKKADAEAEAKKKAEAAAAGKK